MEYNSLNDKSENKRNVILLYKLFLISLIIDIGGSFGLKYFSFLLICLYLIYSFIKGSIRIPVNFLLIEGLIFFCFPLVILSYTIIFYDVAINIAVGELFPLSIWLLYPFLIMIKSKEQMVSTFKYTGLLAAYLTIGMFILLLILYLIGRMDIIRVINEFTTYHRLGFFGQKPFFGMVDGFFPNVYFRWTLLLIPIAVLFFKDSKMKLLVILLSIFLTVSTAAIFFSVLALVWVIVDELYHTNQFGKLVRRFLYGFIFFLILGLMLERLGYLDVFTFIMSKFDSASDSTSVKIGHISSAGNAIFKDALVFLFGMGIGSSFYSVGVSKEVSNIEVSHLNMIRQFGVIYSLIFFFYIFFIFTKLSGLDYTGRLLGIGIFILFIAAGTNPVLLSPVFLVVLVIARAYITLSLRCNNNLKRGTGLG